MSSQDHGMFLVFLLAGCGLPLSIKSVDQLQQVTHIPMKRKTTILCLTATMLSSAVFVSCGQKKDQEAGGESGNTEAVAADNVDTLTDELTMLLNKLGDTMLSAKDKATAEAAVKNIEGIGDEVEALAQRFDKLETPSEEEKLRLDAKMQKASEPLEAKMKEAMPQLFANKEVATILGPAMQKFSMRMAESDAIFERFGKKK